MVAEPRGEESHRPVDDGTDRITERRHDTALVALAVPRATIPARTASDDPGNNVAEVKAETNMPASSQNADMARLPQTDPHQRITQSPVLVLRAQPTM